LESPEGKGHDGGGDEEAGGGVEEFCGVDASYFAAQEPEQNEYFGGGGERIGKR
jgi:hypothetical protein